jgi:hypothetical protein
MKLNLLEELILCVVYRQMVLYHRKDYFRLHTK